MYYAKFSIFRCINFRRGSVPVFCNDEKLLFMVVFTLKEHGYNNLKFFYLAGSDGKTLNFVSELA